MPRDQFLMARNLRLQARIRRFMHRDQFLMARNLRLQARNRSALARNRPVHERDRLGVRRHFVPGTQTRE